MFTFIAIFVALLVAWIMLKLVFKFIKLVVSVAAMAGIGYLFVAHSDTIIPLIQGLIS